MKQIAGKDAVKKLVLCVATTSRDLNRAIGLYLSEAHDGLLSLHLKGVDMVWPSHVDMFVHAELEDQWQVSL